LIEAKFVEGMIVVPRFVLQELQSIVRLLAPARGSGAARAGDASIASSEPAQ